LFKQGPVFNLASKGEIWPKGQNLTPRGDFGPRGVIIPHGWRPSVCPFVLLKRRVCSSLGGWTKGRTLPLGTKDHPWGPSSTLEASFKLML
jgi:hypothetical protein